MPARPAPTAGVVRARRYAAHVRIVIAVLGGGLLLADPNVHMHAIPAAIGLGVIGLTGLVERFVVHERWLKLRGGAVLHRGGVIVGYTRARSTW